MVPPEPVEKVSKKKESSQLDQLIAKVEDLVESEPADDLPKQVDPDEQLLDEGATLVCGPDGCEPFERFTGKPISIDFENTPIQEVLTHIALLGELNIVVDEEVKGAITLKAEKVKWDELFHEVCEENGLKHVFRENVIQVLPREKAVEKRS